MDPSLDHHESDWPGQVIGMPLSQGINEGQFLWPWVRKMWFFKGKKSRFSYLKERKWLLDGQWWQIQRILASYKWTFLSSFTEVPLCVRQLARNCELHQKRGLEDSQLLCKAKWKHKPCAVDSRERSDSFCLRHTLKGFWGLPAVARCIVAQVTAEAWVWSPVQELALLQLWYKL